MVDEVAGGLHGHPAEKIRPGFGQLVDVQQCLQWEDTFWTSWARSPGSCGGCSSLPSCWDTTANGGRRLYYEFCQQVVELNKSLMEKCYYEVYQQEVELNEAAWRECVITSWKTIPTYLGLQVDGHQCLVQGTPVGLVREDLQEDVVDVLHCLLGHHNCWREVLPRPGQIQNIL